MLSPYAARFSGYQGYHAFPHTVMGVGIKGPVPADCGARLEQLGRSVSRLAPADRGESAPRREGAPAALSASIVPRASDEQIADYYTADFTIDLDATASPLRERATPIHAVAA